MSYAELIKAGNEKVMEINKKSRELELLGKRLEEIQKPGSSVAIVCGAATTRLDDILDAPTLSDLTNIAVRYVNVCLEIKKTEVANLLGIKKPELAEAPGEEAPEVETAGKIEPKREAEPEEIEIEKVKREESSISEEEYLESFDPQEPLTTENLCKLVNKDISTEAIAEHWRLSKDTVYKYKCNIKKYGTIRGKDRRKKVAAPEPEPVAAPKSELNAEEVAKLVTVGMSLKAIGEKFGVTKQEVYAFCKKNHIATRKEYAWR